MLKWAIISAIIAVIAGALGFGVIAGAAAGIAKILFFIFLVLFVILLVSAIFVGRKVKSAFSDNASSSGKFLTKRPRGPCSLNHRIKAASIPRT